MQYVHSYYILKTYIQNHYLFQHKHASLLLKLGLFTKVIINYLKVSNKVSNLASCKKQSVQILIHIELFCLSRVIYYVMIHETL